MVNALADVKPLFRRDADSFLRKLENTKRRFIGVGLPGCNDVVEFYFQLGRGLGEKIVVNIGDDCELVTSFELAKGCNGIREGLPVRQRIRQRRNLRSCRSKFKALAEPSDDRL